MKYMMLIYLEKSVSDQIEAGEAEPGDVESVEPWVEEMDGRGIRLLGAPLHPLAEASSVRVRGHEVLISDGPFTETKEYIIGFDLLECENMAAATEVAAEASAGEVRPDGTARAGGGLAAVRAGFRAPGPPGRAASSAAGRRTRRRSHSRWPARPP